MVKFGTQQQNHAIALEERSSSINYVYLLKSHARTVEFGINLFTLAPALKTLSELLQAVNQYQHAQLEKYITH